LFKEKVTDELESITNLIAQKQNYPFMEQLQPLSENLRKLRQMDYATLITTIDTIEGDILDVKEDVLDPIKQFMKSGQKDIYDRLREFEGYNQANFGFVDADEKGTITKVKEDPTPYRGSVMKDAKEAMDALEKRVKIALKSEKETTKERVEERLGDLKSRSEFNVLSSQQQKEVLQPLENTLRQVESERFIGNLRNIRTELGDLYTRQLNRIIELSTPEEETEPKRLFIKQSNIHPKISKKELETEEDVDEYLRSLREAMVKHIQKNHNIILD
jgi:hypothetical protein